MLYHQNSSCAPQNMNAPKLRSDFVEVSEEQEVQIFAKQMLVHRLFLGHYQERRYVDTLKSYRDVVLIHNSEHKLERDLEIVKRRIETFYRDDSIWIGMTGPKVIGAPAGHCVWVRLQKLAFGYYWFQIKQVTFSDNQEVSLRLECIRSVDPEVLGTSPSISSQTTPVLEPDEEPRTSPAPSTPQEVGPTLDVSHVMNNFKEIIRPDVVMTKVLANLVSILTVHNVKEATNFTKVFLIACVTGLISLTRCVGEFTLRFIREISIFIQATTPIFRYVGEFTLSFMREISIFIQATTPIFRYVGEFTLSFVREILIFIQSTIPIFIAIIDFFSKCVGGLYILIAMMWRGTPVHTLRQGPTLHIQQEPTRPAIKYAIKYRHIPQMNQNHNRRKLY